MFVAFVPFVYFRRKSEQKLTKAIRNQSVLGRKPNPFVAFCFLLFLESGKGQRNSQIALRQPLIRRWRN